MWKIYIGLTSPKNVSGHAPIFITIVTYDKPVWTFDKDERDMESMYSVSRAADHFGPERYMHSVARSRGMFPAGLTPSSPGRASSNPCLDYRSLHLGEQYLGGHD
ncbi:hypothetical protein RRG08_049054 [Elysia crispata]|uniref:Uncharacterized protein n=1 Tax=Elysia crispata TaxID=231223 RepID=A0AAE1A9R2_9GAST|nr:hypothetical protein RRG08_049054 [Elysia crispata]